MSLPGSVRRLFVGAKTQSFKRHELLQLKSTLHGVDEATELRDIFSPTDLQLGSDGRTLRDGLRLSPVAYSQVASILFGGLRQFLFQLSGQQLPGREADKHLVDGELAVEIWNKIAVLRFPRLGSFRLIVDTSRRTIDGVIGRSKAYFSNSGVLSLLESTMGAERFVSARLGGRQMSTWWVGDKICDFGYVDGSCEFFTGWYCGNAELRGSAVKLSPAIVSSVGAAVPSISRFGDQVRHSGPAAMDRLASAVSRTYAATTGMTEEQITTNMARSLGLSAADDRRSRSTKRRRLVDRLVSGGILRARGQTCVDRLLAKLLPGEHKYRSPESLCVFDLFSACAEESRQLVSDRYTHVAAVSFDLLETGLCHEQQVV